VTVSNRNLHELLGLRAIRFSAVTARDTTSDLPRTGEPNRMKEFLTDVTQLRERARAQRDQGPVAEAYGADLPRVLEVLISALATEIVCVLRYRQHHFAAKGLASEPVAAEFLVHADDMLNLIEDIA